METLDRRLHAWRPDLADAALEGRVQATRFVTGEAAVVRSGAADLRAAPDASLGLDTQLLFGEEVVRFEERDGWAWVRSRRDGYVGYVRADALTAPWGAPTHQVTALRSFLYPRPDLKAPVLDALSMTSRVRVVGERGSFCEIAGGGWLFGAHLAAAEAAGPDPVDTALRFVGLPYRWGGKESVGLDCSALVQLAWHRAGRACPRDSDMQAAGVGTAVAPDEPIRRGDLLFLPGHVTVAVDAAHVVHATAHGMLVCVEAMAAVLARARAEHGTGLLGVRRP